MRPSFSAPTRFVGNGKADFSGTVRYSLLYVGPDGRLYGAEEEMPYDFSTPLEGLGAGEELTLWAELLPDAVISRVAAPRRLSLRCRLHARIKGYAMQELAPRLSGDAEGEPLQLCGIGSAAAVFAGAGECVELSDTVVTDQGGEMRIVSCGAECFLPEIMAGEGIVRCKGEVVCTLLCVRESEGAEGEPFVLSKRIPFEETVPVEGATPGCDALAVGTVEAASATAEEGGAQIAVRLSLEARARREEALCYTRDLFLPGATAECRYGTERVMHHGQCANRNFSFFGEKTVQEAGLPATAEVVCAVAEAELKEHAAENGHTAMSGEALCHILYKNGKEYGVAETAVPFRAVLDGAWSELEGRVAVPLLRVSVSGEKLRVDGELQTSILAGEIEEIKRVSEAAFVPVRTAPRAGMEICYPKAGETLWEVAKRSGIPPQTLAMANGISAEAPGEDDSLAGVRYVVLP